MRRDPDGRFVHVALAAEALFLSVCVGPVMKRRTSRGGGDRGYLWSPHGAKADLIGEMGRLDAKERMRERERERVREWGTRWERGREDGRHVGVLLGKWPRVSSRTFACRGDKRSPSKWFYRTVLEF